MTFSIRAVATVAAAHSLYLIAGNLGLDLFPPASDEVLADWDRRFFGTVPSFWASARLGSGSFELACLVYVGFLPFIYTAIIAGCFSGEQRRREEFLNGLALTYALSLPFHLFFPAAGPRVLRPELFAGFLDSGPFHRAAVWLVDGAGGPHGAFPSLHVGASAACCLLELRHRPWLGRLYLPATILIAASGVLTGYHYAVDVLAGAAIAAVAAGLSGASARDAAWPSRGS